MIINVFKEKSWTSFDVVAKLRGILRIKKIGHAGTLDPLAEGVLIILTGADTKRQEELMKTTKEYIAEITFGATTDTYDLEQIPIMSMEQITLASLKSQLQEVLKFFIGEIDQTAPPYSAKKVKGKTLYKEARKRKIDKAELPVKRITIFEFEIVEILSKTISTDKGNYKLPVLRCRILCSSGTYIRSIAYDMGQSLGCGGVLTDLIRTKVGDYKVENAIKVSEIEEKVKSNRFSSSEL